MLLLQQYKDKYGYNVLLNFSKLLARLTLFEKTADPQNNSDKSQQTREGACVKVVLLWDLIETCFTIKCLIGLMHHPF